MNKHQIRTVRCLGFAIVLFWGVVIWHIVT